MSVRCRLGLHTKTTVPPEIVERMRSIGHLRLPNWYIGPRVPLYCTRCDWRSPQYEQAARRASEALATIHENVAKSENRQAEE